MVADNKLDMKRVEAALKRKASQAYRPVKVVRQLGFIHNNVDCIGCRACEIACKDKNGLAPGPRFRNVMYVEGGTFPNVYAYKVNMSCNVSPFRRDSRDMEEAAVGPSQEVFSLGATLTKKKKFHTQPAI